MLFFITDSPNIFLVSLMPFVICNLTVINKRLHDYLSDKQRVGNVSFILV
jgi:hypothetical protein